jgi:hypothetical protein
VKPGLCSDRLVINHLSHGKAKWSCYYDWKQEVIHRRKNKLSRLPSCKNETGRKSKPINSETRKVYQMKVRLALSICLIFSFSDM